MAGTVFFAKLTIVTVLIIVGIASSVGAVDQPSPPPPPLHSKSPSARLFDDTIIVKYKEKDHRIDKDKQPRDEYIPDILDTSDPEQRKIKMDSIAASFRKVPGLSGLTVIRTLPILGIQHFKLGPGQSLNTVILLLRSQPSVQFADYNFRVIAQSSPPTDPNEPLWLGGNFWGLRKIGMRNAWGYQTGANSITVAVLDTGIDLLHPDLKPNIANSGKNFCSDGGTNHTDHIQDTIGHGTQVAGIVGAVGNNNYGTVGAAWQVTLLPLKMLCSIDEEDGKPGGSVESAQQAIEEAISQGIDIINNSWRVAYPAVRADLPSLEGAIKKTNCQGPTPPLNCKRALFVAAAGNLGLGETSKNSDPCLPQPYDNDCNAQVFPASYGTDPPIISNVISVAATTCLDLGHDFVTCTDDPLLDASHYGATTVHIAAPGDQIEATTIFDTAHPEYSYNPLSGTSASAPLVSGCAVLLQARNQDVNGSFLSIEALKTKLFNYADKHTVLNPKWVSNHSFPNKDGVIDGQRLNCANAIAHIP